MEACSEPASAQELPGFAHDKMGIGVFAGVEGSANPGLLERLVCRCLWALVSRPHK